MMRAAVAEQTDVATLRKRHADAEAKWQALADELRGIQLLIDPRVDDKPSSSRVERLLATARGADCRRELALAEAVHEDAARDLRQGQDAERQRARAEFARKKAPVVKRLDRALDKARVINAELLALEDAEENSCGMTARLAWPELVAESPTVASRFPTWRRFCKSEGFDIG